MFFGELLRMSASFRGWFYLIRDILAAHADMRCACTAPQGRLTGQTSPASRNTGPGSCSELLCPALGSGHISGPEVRYIACQVKDDLLELLAVACLMIAAKQGERSSHLPSNADIEHVTALQVQLILPLPKDSL